MPTGKPDKAPGTTLTKRRIHWRTKPQLLTREQLDGRTNAAKYFDALASRIEADLGGHDQLSAIELTLVEAYVGAAVSLQNLNTRLALGQEIDLGQHAQCVSAMVRVASRLGLRRRQKDPQGMEEFLASIKDQQLEQQVDQQDEAEQ